MFDGWDGLRGCEICGNDTVGRLCHSCAWQEMIDNSDEIPPVIEWCGDCGGYMALGDGGTCENCGKILKFI